MTSWKPALCLSNVAWPIVTSSYRLASASQLWRGDQSVMALCVFIARLLCRRVAHILIQFRGVDFVHENEKARAFCKRLSAVAIASLYDYP